MSRTCLASCYRRALELAREHDARTVAFPSISTGIDGYPVERAAPLAVATVRAFLQESELPERVLVACIDERTYSAFRRAAGSRSG